MIVIGPHTLFNQSIDQLQLSPVLNGRKARAMYVDPPWGPGNMKYWATIAKRQTGLSGENIAFDALLAQLVTIVQEHVHGHVFIEMGLRWISELENAMSGLLSDVVVEPTLYRNGSKTHNGLSPATLLHGRTRGSTTAVNSPALHNVLGQALADAAIAQIAIPGEYVIDPCCGMGYTAQAALKHKMHFIGNELNLSRLQKTEGRIRVMTGLH